MSMIAEIAFALHWGMDDIKKLELNEFRFYHGKAMELLGRVR